jgi:hypothetical protein
MEEIDDIPSTQLRAIAQQIIIENFAHGEDLAVLIVDALCFAGLVKAADVDRAIDIVKDEIEAHREARND